MRSLSLVLIFISAFLAPSYANPSTNPTTLETRKHSDNNSTASDNSNSSPQHALNKSCKKLRNLNALSQLTANQTKLDSWLASGKLTTNDVDALKAKAANATAELQLLSSNATLVSECAVVDAERKSVRQCKAMKTLGKLAALAGNETAMSAFEQGKGLNETGVEKLKARIAEAENKLKELEGNTTLVDFCTQRAQQEQKGDASSSGSSTDKTTASQATGSAARFTAQTMPYILVPALAAVFALFL